MMLPPWVTVETNVVAAVVWAVVAAAAAVVGLSVVPGVV